MDFIDYFLKFNLVLYNHIHLFIINLFLLEPKVLFKYQIIFDL